MRFNQIASVTLKAPRTGQPDRRGCLAIFYAKPYANREGVLRDIATLVRHVVALLDTAYRWPDAEADPFGEAQECWVNENYTERGDWVWLNHKYWSDEQIATFHQLLRTLAGLHRWTVSDETLPEQTTHDRLRTDPGAAATRRE